MSQDAIAKADDYKKQVRGRLRARWGTQDAGAIPRESLGGGNLHPPSDFSIPRGRGVGQRRTRAAHVVTRTCVCQHSGEQLCPRLCARPLVCQRAATSAARRRGEELSGRSVSVGRGAAEEHLPACTSSLGLCACVRAHPPSCGTHGQWGAPHAL